MPGLRLVSRSGIRAALPLWAAHQQMQQQGAHTGSNKMTAGDGQQLQAARAALLSGMMRAQKIGSPAGNATGRRTCRHSCVLPRPAAPTNCASNGWHVAQIVSRQRRQLGHGMAASTQQRGGSSAALASAAASSGFAGNQAANQAAHTSVTLPAGRPPSRAASSGPKLVRRCSGLAAASRSRSATWRG